MVLDIIDEQVKREVKGGLYGIRGEMCEYRAMEVPTNSFVITLPEEYRTLSSRYAFKKARHIFNTYVELLICCLKLFVCLSKLLQYLLDCMHLLSFLLV